MHRCWGLAGAVMAMVAVQLGAHPAAAQIPASSNPPTVRAILQEMPVHPDARPFRQPWTANDQQQVRPDQTFAELRRTYASQVRFRHADGSLNANRGLFVPGAAALGEHIFNLTFQRNGAGRNVAHLVTISGNGSQGQCDAQFEKFLSAATKALDLNAADWQSSNAAAAAVPSPFSAQDSWTGAAGWNYNRLAGVFNGAARPALRTAPGGARYGVVGPEMVFGTRHAVAIAPGSTPEGLTIALAEFSTPGSPVPGRCRLALVRTAPGSVKAAPATLTVPADRVLDRSDFNRSRTLAAQYAQLQPATPGVLAPPAALPAGTLRLACGIEAEGGTLSGCRQSGPPRDPVAPVARDPGIESVAAILRGLQLKTWQFDEDFFGTVPVQVEFTAAPDDLPPVIDWDAVPLQPANAVSFDKPLRVLSDDYPVRALRAELDSIVTMDCVILSDLSPYCGRYLIEPVESVAAFTPVLRTIHRRNVVRRARPLGKDGQTAVGQRYRQRIVFMVPD